MLRTRASLATLIVAGLALLAPGTTFGSTFSLGTDGKTAGLRLPQATRERVYIPQPGIDQDGDGQADRSRSRSSARQGTGPGSVPAIVDPSPYYTTVCRGNEGAVHRRRRRRRRQRQLAAVPRQLLRPARLRLHPRRVRRHRQLDRLPAARRPGRHRRDEVGDRLAQRARRPATDARTQRRRRVVAQRQGRDDRQVLRRHARQRRRGDGRRGAEDDRPDSAISDWYAYSRMGGIRFNTHYPRSLSTRHDTPTAPACAASRAALDAADGDATGDRNAFWDDARLPGPDVGERPRRRPRDPRPAGRQRSWTTSRRGGPA